MPTAFSQGIHPTDTNRVRLIKAYKMLQYAAKRVEADSLANIRRAQILAAVDRIAALRTADVAKDTIIAATARQRNDFRNAFNEVSPKYIDVQLRLNQELQKPNRTFLGTLADVAAGFGAGWLIKDLFTRSSP